MLKQTFFVLNTDSEYAFVYIRSFQSHIVNLKKKISWLKRTDYFPKVYTTSHLTDNLLSRCNRQERINLSRNHFFVGNFLNDYGKMSIMSLRATIICRKTFNIPVYNLPDIIISDQYIHIIECVLLLRENVGGFGNYGDVSISFAPFIIFCLFMDTAIFAYTLRE